MKTLSKAQLVLGLVLNHRTVTVEEACNLLGIDPSDPELSNSSELTLYRQARNIKRDIFIMDWLEGSGKYFTR